MRHAGRRQSQGRPTAAASRKNQILFDRQEVKGIAVDTACLHNIFDRNIREWTFFQKRDKGIFDCFLCEISHSHTSFTRISTISESSHFKATQIFARVSSVTDSPLPIFVMTFDESEDAC